MLRIFLFSILSTSLTVSSLSQQLSVADKQIVDSTRSKYYNLRAAGFESMNCSVDFDFSTVPLLSPAKDNPTRTLLTATRFSLNLDSNSSPTINHVYPAGTSEAAQQQASQIITVISSLVSGVFQTWPSKGLQGPIPPFDSQIESVKKTDSGYTFNLRVPGSPVQVFTDKNFLAYRIVSGGGQVDEHVSYVQKSVGLVFGADDTVDIGDKGEKVTVKYELDYAIINGLTVPSSVHLIVDRNIDVRFALTGCSVQKNLVIHVEPPPATNP